MSLRNAIITLVFLILAGVAYAQSTSTPVQLGYLSTTGCFGGSPCFLPYTNAHPLIAGSN